MAPHPDWANTLPHGWIEAVTQALLHYNPLAQNLIYLSNLDQRFCPQAQLTLQETGSAHEIVAILNYENTILSQTQPQQFLVIKKMVICRRYPQLVTFGSL